MDKLYRNSRSKCKTENKTPINCKKSRSKCKIENRTPIKCKKSRNCKTDNRKLDNRKQRINCTVKPKTENRKKD